MNDNVGEVRPSQYITTFGPGAIVDLPDYSIIMAGINKWSKEDVSSAKTIEEPRLKKQLNIQQIKTVPIGDKKSTLPAYKFPEYHVCPSCRRLGKYNGMDFVEEEGILYCKNPDQEKPCNKIKTHPVRFITACKNGHIQDFPWLYFVHKKNEYDKKCRLYLIDEGETGSISDLKVYCSKCKEERLLKEAYENKKLLEKCYGERPWLRDRESEECKEEKKLLLRGASNIYFSSLLSSIVIPPESYNSLDALVEEKVDLNDEEAMEDWKTFETVYSRNHDVNRLGLEEVWYTAQKLRKSNDKEPESIKAPEYNAFLREPYNYDGDEFEVEKVKVPARYNSLITNLIRVKRLKEVMVLKGFTRIQPLPDVTARLSANEEDDSEEKSSKEAPITDVKAPDWLPGIESYGEGLFFSIDETKLKQWERENKEYRDSMENAHNKMHKERGRKSGEIPAFPGIRYVLLHTLSHALMREITLHSGYSSSALKERIYSSQQEGMAGILIYTSTVDSEGSLGGLVELGKSVNFESLLVRALTNAEYCSGDPQCAEHGGEKLIDVNGAACHSCLLESETSCENSNRYLDRTILVKTVLNQDREFFVDG